MGRRKNQGWQKAEWYRGETSAHPQMPPWLWNFQPRPKIKMDSTCCGSYSKSCQAAHPRNRAEGKPAAPSNPIRGLPVFLHLAFHHSATLAHSNSAALLSVLVALSPCQSIANTDTVGTHQGLWSLAPRQRLVRPSSPPATFPCQVVLG